MNTYRSSTRIIAGILLFSHILTSCSGLGVTTKPVFKAPVSYTIIDQASSLATDDEETLFLSPVKSNQRSEQALVPQYEQALTDNNYSQSSSRNNQVLVDLNTAQPSNRTYAGYPMHTRVATHTKGHSLLYDQNIIDKKLSGLHHQKLLQASEVNHHQNRQAAEQQFIAKELLGNHFQLKAGKEVTFYEEAGGLKAKTSSGLALNVYIGNINLNQAIQPKHIHIVIPQQDKNKKGYVYIDQGGLAGGMMSNDNNAHTTFNPLPYIRKKIKEAVDLEDGTLFNWLTSELNEIRINAHSYSSKEGYIKQKIKDVAKNNQPDTIIDWLIKESNAPNNQAISSLQKDEVKQKVDKQVIGLGSVSPPIQPLSTKKGPVGTSKSLGKEEENNQADIEKFRLKCVENKFTETLQKISQEVVKNKIPTCFVSYAWHDPQADGSTNPLDARVHQAVDYLLKAGIQVYLDLKHNHVGTSIDKFVCLIDQANYVIWMGTLKLQEKCTPDNLKRAYEVEFENKPLAENEKHLPVVSRETVRIKQRIGQEGEKFLLPACLEAEHPQVFPGFIRSIASQPMKEWPNYSAIFWFLKVMLPSLRADIEQHEQAFKGSQNQVGQMSNEKVAQLAREIEKFEADKQAQFEQALSASMRAGFASQEENNESGSIDYEEGVEKSHKKSFEYYQQAADRGHADAQNRLGSLYFYGKGIEKNYTKAVYWFKKAADQGYADAQNNLGTMYKNGFGILKEYMKAIEWFVKAADQGLALARNNLGDMYYYGEGVEQDCKKSFEYYQQAAYQEYAASQFNLGWMYENGHGLEKDLNKAFEWYTKAAEHGLTAAQINLGGMYQNGYEIEKNGIAKNYMQAIEWYQKAAEQGCADVQISLKYARKILGDIYYYGKGIEKDYKKSFECYQQAADQGYAVAQNELGWMYYYGEGVEKDLNKAFEWFKKAAEQGLAAAQINLGGMYQNGYGNKN